MDALTGKITYADLLECKNLSVWIDERLEQITRLESQVERITTVIKQTNGFGRGAVSDGMAEKIARLLDMRDVLLDAVIDRKAKVNAIRIEMAHLPPEQIRVIELRYFDNLPWNTIAERMHYERRQCFRIHKTALKNLGIQKPCH